MRFSDFFSGCSIHFTGASRLIDSGYGRPPNEETPPDSQISREIEKVSCRTNKWTCKVNEVHQLMRKVKWFTNSPSCDVRVDLQCKRRRVSSDAGKKVTLVCCVVLLGLSPVTNSNGKSHDQRARRTQPIRSFDWREETNRRNQIYR